jgi:hypothetical protein
LNLQREREREREKVNAKANLELLLSSGNRRHGGGQGGTGVDPTMMEVMWHRSGHGVGVGTCRRRCGQRVADEERRRRLQLMEEASLYIGVAAMARRRAWFPGAATA